MSSMRKEQKFYLPYKDITCTYSPARRRILTLQDNHKKRLTSDPHWAQMRSLSGLNFFNRSQLQKIGDRLGELWSCPSLTANDLRSRPQCPACGLTPRTYNPPSSASIQLQEISQEFDLLYQSWVSGLRENLKSESSQENLRQIADRDQEPIRAYIQSGQLPERLTERFVSALSDTLQGLDKITIEGADRC